MAFSSHPGGIEHRHGITNGLRRRVNAQSFDGIDNRLDAGTYNEGAAMNAVIGTTQQMLPLIDKWGGPETYPHFAMGWAWAGNTPYPWVKQIAGHLGGTRTGMAVRWPKGIQARVEIRSKFHHVIDIAPTVLAAANIPQPKAVNDIQQRPMDGVPMQSAFADAKAPDQRVTQYFSIFGNRGIYHEGWLESTLHNIPWLWNQKLPPLEDDVWELYDLRTDFSQAENIAAKHPEKLKELLAATTERTCRSTTKKASNAFTGKINKVTISVE